MRHHLRLTLCALVALAAVLAALSPTRAQDDKRPNILFAIADDWGWPHAAAYGDAVLQTPAFDRIAREGVLFNHAYVSSPSCTPSRGAILTGQQFWRLEGAANLWSVFPDKFAVYPEILEKNGYISGFTGKGWGPGRTATPNRPIAGHRFPGLRPFLAKRAEQSQGSVGKPFVFWLGTSDPHRPFDKGSGQRSGMDLAKLHLFGHYPDAPEVRGDVADYYWEVQRFDRLVADALAALEQAGELDNTIVVMTGDHGMPFPRCKGNLYDGGARVPLAIRWGDKVAKPGRKLDDFVSLADMAPTFLQAAGVAIPDDMTGRSVLNLLTSEKTGRIDPARDFIITGRERHVPGQEGDDMGGYPSRAIRTHAFLYIRNFTPDRWPAGTPHYTKAAIPGAWLADCDNGPTKTYMVEHRDKDAAHRRAYDLSFAKRPAEELYDLARDPEQLDNIAAAPAYAKVKQELASRLMAQLAATGDPRASGGATGGASGGGAGFDAFPYLGGGPKHPDFRPQR